MAVCGRPPTAAIRSPASGRTRRPTRLAPSTWLPPTTTSFIWDPAKATRATRSHTGWASGARPTAGTPGPTSASTTRSASSAFAYTRTTPTSRTSARWATNGEPTRNAAYTEPLTAAPAGRTSCRSTMTRAARTSISTSATRASYTPACGPSAASPGISATAPAKRRSTRPRTVATAGPRSTWSMSPWRESAWPWRRAIPAPFTW